MGDVLVSDGIQDFDSLLADIDDKGYPVSKMMGILAEGKGPASRDALDYYLSAWIRLLSIQNQDEPCFLDEHWTRIRTLRIRSESSLIALRDLLRTFADVSSLALAIREGQAGLLAQFPHEHFVSMLGHHCGNRRQ